MCYHCTVYMFDSLNLNSCFYIIIKSNYENHGTETLLSKRYFKIWNFDGNWVYLLRLVRSATWIWNKPTVEPLGRLHPKDVPHVREESKGLVSPLLKPFSGTCLNSPNPVHSISLVLNLYYYDILLPHFYEYVHCLYRNSTYMSSLPYSVCSSLSSAMKLEIWIYKYGKMRETLSRVCRSWCADSNVYSINAPGWYVTGAYKITALSFAYWICNAALANVCCWRLHVLRTRNGKVMASGDKQKATRIFPWKSDLTRDVISGRLVTSLL
jgi:hypothetical protein